MVYSKKRNASTRAIMAFSDFNILQFMPHYEYTDDADLNKKKIFFLNSLLNVYAKTVKKKLLQLLLLFRAESNDDVMILYNSHI